MTREEAKTILRETSVTPYIHPDSIGKYFDAMKMAIEALKQPEIVRCKDCKHRNEANSPYWEIWCERNDHGVDGDWFCADGERKGEQHEECV